MKAYLRITIIVTLATLCLAISANAQELSNTTWKHPTEEVYLKFKDPGFEVWQVVKGRQCTMYPSIYHYDGEKIITDDGRGQNMEWRVEYVKEDSMKINFPNGENVVYRSSSFYPSVSCDIKGDGRKGI
jgi:hypothetical protein